MAVRGKKTPDTSANWSQALIMSLFPEMGHKQNRWQLWNVVNSHVDTNHLIHLSAGNLGTPERRDGTPFKHTSSRTW